MSQTVLPLAGLLSLLLCHLVDGLEVDTHLHRHQPGAANVSKSERHTELLTFHSYVHKYGRQFRKGSREFVERAALWHRRFAEVQKHNSRPNRLWTAGINRLSDRTESELAQLRGWRGGASRQAGATAGSSPRHGMFLNQGRARVLPQEFLNWTRLDSLKHIKDQGGCGSCWAITSATVLEAHAEIYRSPRTFSTQELVSCVPNPHSCGGTGGCDGATVELAFNWAMTRGILSEGEDPYMGVTGQCNGHKNAVMVEHSSHGNVDEDFGLPGVHLARVGTPGPNFGMVGWERLPENKYEPLLRALMEHGPVAVSVAASEWYSYLDGVFDGCGRDAVIDHAVTMLGFGYDPKLKEKFWLIQNSWGGDWGEQGKIRILRRDSDETEQCGVDHQPELGTACAGGPKQVNVCGMCGILYDSAVPHFRSEVSPMEA